MSFLVVIRGPLGVGKSTIAKKLALAIKGDYFSIDDTLAQNNLDRIDKKEGSIPLANFLQANKLVFPKINQAIQTEKPIVIDGNFYHLGQIEDLIKNLPCQSFVFTLTASLETCIERDSQRPKSYGRKAATAVYNLVSSFNYGQVIDTRSLSIDETVSLISSYLK